MFRQSSKSGLILPRSSMVNPYTAQGLPAIYGQLSPNLQMMIDMRERTGDKLYDISGNGYNYPIVAGGSGNTLAQMWSNGEPGGLDFDGVNDYLNAGTGLKTWWDNGKTWSIEAWLTMSAFTAIQSIIGIQNYTGGQYYYMMLYIASGRFEAYLSSASTIKYRRANLPASVVANKPFHLVCKYNGSADSTGIKLDINGVYIDLTTVTNGSSTSTFWTNLPGDVCIMSERVVNTSSIQYCFDGRLNFFAGYDKTLSTPESLAKYNADKSFMQ